MRDEAIAGLEQRVSLLDRVASVLSERVAERELELRALRAGLEEAREAAREVPVAPAEETLQGTADGSPFGAADGPREESDDGSPAGDGGSRGDADDLLPPELDGEELVITRSARPGSDGVGAATAAAPEAPEVASPSTPPLSGAAATAPEAVAPTRPVRPGTWEGTVDIDVGPFGDFSGLVGFEDATAAIPGVESVAVTRFAGRRATLRVELAARVNLPAALADETPCELSLRQAEPGRLVFDVA